MGIGSAAASLACSFHMQVLLPIKTPNLIAAPRVALSAASTRKCTSRQRRESTASVPRFTANPHKTLTLAMQTASHQGPSSPFAGHLLDIHPSDCPPGLYSTNWPMSAKAQSKRKSQCLVRAVGSFGLFTRRFLAGWAFDGLRQCQQDLRDAIETVHIAVETFHQVGLSRSIWDVLLWWRAVCHMPYRLVYTVIC
jgi:hypothetical protein